MIEDHPRALQAARYDGLHVSSVWLSAPSRFATTIATGNPKSAARSLTK